MGAGSWGQKNTSEDAGQTPVNMSAWSRLQQKWFTPTIITNGTTNNIVLNASDTNDYNIIKIPTNVSNEYFLLENRGTTKYDRGLYILNESTFQGGISIWHIDDTQTNNDNENRKWVDLEEANDAGLDSGANRGKQTNLFYSGNNSVFNNTSSPNSKLYNGTSSGIDIDNISIRGTAMYFDIAKN
jgi:hypothetical protein